MVSAQSSSRCQGSGPVRRLEEVTQRCVYIVNLPRNGFLVYVPGTEIVRAVCCLSHAERRLRLSSPRLPPCSRPSRAESKRVRIVVEIGTEPPKRLPAPRTWSLSAWPVRVKVAAVVALPLVLAMGFGALRIQAELSAAAELSSAADKARIVAPALALDQMVGNFALTGVPESDQDLTAAADTVRDALHATESGDPLGRVAAFDAAADNAENVRAELERGPVAPVERADVSEDMTEAIAGVLTAGLTVESLEPRTLTNAIVDAMSGRRAAQTQQLFVSIPDAEMIDRVNRVAGSESADISALEGALGADSSEIVTLRSQLDTRLGMYAAAEGGGPTNPFLSAGQSAEMYGSIAGRLTGDLVDTLAAEALDRRSVALRDTALVLGSVLLALVLALIVARSLVQPIKRLRIGALGVAQRALPAEIEQIRSGGHTPEIVPIPVHSQEEIGQLARAVDAIHEEALQLAGEQARLRVQVGNMFETLSRRSRSLVDQQLALIEELERDEDDPHRLDSLFRLDHLATRMRRNGANLMVLAGTRSRRNQGDQPVALDAVMTAAVSEVEDYRRVLMLDAPDAALAASAAADVVHLVAELIDNALRYSPPDSAVAVTAARAIEGGILLEVADRGLGMPAADIDETNQRLSAGGEVTPETARRMGLFVVGRLAQRHCITVRLRATQVEGGTSGITVSVHLPASLVVTSFPTAEHVRSNRRDAALAADKSSAVPRNGSAVHTPTSQPETATERTSPVSLIALDDDTAEPPEVTAAQLPKRRPGASGVEGHRSLSSGPADTATPSPVERKMNGAPSDTSSFFGARPAARAARDTGVGDSQPDTRSERTIPPPPDPLAPPAQTVPIYQRMVSEWLVDPATGQGRARLWSSPADAGWAAAESATEAQVRSRTESGLPVRKPGARLVPGAVDTARGPAHRRDAALSAVPPRSPEAVRDRLTSHFTGVRTGRAEDVSGRHRTEEDE